MPWICQAGKRADLRQLACERRISLGNIKCCTGLQKRCGQESRRNRFPKERGSFEFLKKEGETASNGPNYAAAGPGAASYAEAAGALRLSAAEASLYQAVRGCTGGGRRRVQVDPASAAVRWCSVRIGDRKSGCRTLRRSRRGPRGQYGINAFLEQYLESLLICGGAGADVSACGGKPGSGGAAVRTG